MMPVAAFKMLRRGTRILRVMPRPGRPCHLVNLHG